MNATFRSMSVRSSERAKVHQRVGRLKAPGIFRKGPAVRLGAMGRRGERRWAHRTCMDRGCLRSPAYEGDWSCDRGFGLHLRAHMSGGGPLLATSRVEYEPCPARTRGGTMSAAAPASAPQVAVREAFALQHGCTA